MIEINVELGSRSYPIHIGQGALDAAGSELKRLKATRVLLVTNTTVGPLYAARVVESIKKALPDVPVAVVELPDGEQYKDLDHVRLILDAAVEAGLDVPRGLEMGPFSKPSALNPAVTPLAAWSGYTYALHFPDLTPAPDRAERLAALRAAYGRTLAEFPDFGQGHTTLILAERTSP